MDETIDAFSPANPLLAMREIPTLPESKATNRIDRHERRLTGSEQETVEHDLNAVHQTHRPSPRNAPPFPLVEEMEKRLRAEVPNAEVRFDRGSRAMYATDASNYRQVPIGVVIPKSLDDIVKTVAIARAFGAPVLSRGGGTSLAGQCCNVALVMDMSKYYNRLLEVNEQERFAIVEPGIVLDVLDEAVAPFGLIFGPDPATHNHCTIGGMIGNNSCGMHAQMAGRTEYNVEALEVLTYEGQRFWVGPTSDAELAAIIEEGDAKGGIYAKLKNLRDRYGDLVRARFPDIPRKVSGYCLDNLLAEKGFDVAKALVGTESTCVTILKAKLRLVHNPPKRAIVILGFRNIFIAADQVPEILKLKPIGFEGIDEVLVEHMKRKGLSEDDLDILPDGEAWLVLEFGADKEDDLLAQVAAMKALTARLTEMPAVRVLTDPDKQKRLWHVREQGLGATARVPGARETWEGWEDSAVPPSKLGFYLRGLQALYDKYGYSGALYGHFGQGCVHTRIDFDLLTHEGIRKFREFLHEAAHLVVSCGGSLSGEHGDGQSKAELLPIMFGRELVEAFSEFKRIWDPQGKMNPGKIVDPYRADQNLRIGVEYNPPVWKTHFQFPEDSGSFARASTRCVGVGECRREKGGVMCPSYMVTKEEMHSTRGRARLLFEMLEGNPLQQSWHEKKVKEALDLCLACKGCRNDCPMNVDMATYKSEFLSHYYARRLRPMAAYSMGLIRLWARIGSHFPRLVNFLMRARGLSTILKFLGGIHTERSIPEFSSQTFRDWFESRPKTAFATGKRVILWADTFNNFFHSQVARAAVEVLERAGFRIELPQAKLCCGRPLYDYGMLDLAKRHLREILESLKNEIRDGVPIVALEPSCAAVFRDELVSLFPHDFNAQRLHTQVFLLPEFIHEFAEDFKPLLDKAAGVGGGRSLLLHVHCHQHAVIGEKADFEILKKLGFNVKLLDSGCCGMAGSFGFEAAHFEISKKIGERALLPTVRACPDAIVVTNGFSCREQIEQLSAAKPRHFAELLSESLRSV